MKQFIGTLLALLVLFISSYFLLRMWGIELLSTENLNKTLSTIGILAVTAIILVNVIIIPFFYKWQKRKIRRNRYRCAKENKVNSACQFEIC